MGTLFRAAEVKEARSHYTRFELDHMEELDSRHLIDDSAPPRVRGQPPPLPVRLRAEAPAKLLARKPLPPRARALPPPIPIRAALADAFAPGSILPRAPSTLGWAMPQPQAGPSLRTLELAQSRVEARANTEHDPKSWYTTAAFEIRRAEVSGDRRLLHSALLSLDFADRASDSLRSRFSGDRQLHKFRIGELREIVNARLQESSHLN